MKFQKNPHYRSIALFCVIVAAFAVLCVIAGLNLSKFSSLLAVLLSASRPLIYAFVIAFMLRPLLGVIKSALHRIKSEKLRGVLSVILTYITLLCFLAAFISIFIPQVVSGYNELSSKASDYLSFFRDYVGSVINRYEYLTPYYDKIMEYADEFVANIYKFVETLSPYLLTYAGRFVTETKNIGLGLIFSVYFLTYQPRLNAQFKKAARALFPQKAYDYVSHVTDLTALTFRDFFVGKTLDCLLMGLCCIVAMTLFNLPYAPLVSLIIGVSCFIPYVGILIGAVPGAVIVLLAQPSKLWIFLVIVIALQIIDANFIEPKLLSNGGTLGVMWVLIAILLMGGFFGIYGLIFGVPVFSVLYKLFAEFVASRLRAKNMPEDTASYYSGTRPFEYNKLSSLPRKFKRRDQRK